MVKFRAKSVLMVGLSCILLLSGCTTGKLGGADPDKSVEKTTSQQGTQAQTTVEQSNNSLDVTAGTSNDTSTVTENKPTTETPSVIKVKALYLTGWTVGSTAKVNHFIELTKNTEINSYVIDIKDDDGKVGYESQVPEVKANGTWLKKYDPDKVLKAFHDNGVHVIGRLVAFKDPAYSVKRPDLAIKSTNGGIWKDNKKLSWLNPYNKDAWAYLVSIAKEAVAKGFDEIQFDYVRFPSDGNKKTMDFSGMTKEKYQAISEFLTYAANEMPGVPVSADVFGIIFESPADTEGIGQYLEEVGKNISYISPMVYPSHYAYGQIVNKVEFPAPDLEPYKVVYNTLVKGKERLSKVSDYKAGVRPYLQDFNASWLRPKNGKKMYQNYGAEQVKEQIKAVYDAGCEEWILWDPSNTYDEEAFAKK